MSDDVIDDQNDDSESHDIRELRRKAREADQLQARLATLERENAFAKAGVAVDDPKFKYFVKAYDGDLDPAAIKAELAETGLLQPAAPASAEPTQDQVALQRIAAAAAGGGAPRDMTWQDALAQADQIQNEAQRTQAILDVVERYGGATSRSAQ